MGSRSITRRLQGTDVYQRLLSNGESRLCLALAALPRRYCHSLRNWPQSVSSNSSTSLARAVERPKAKATAVGLRQLSIAASEPSVAKGPLVFYKACAAQGMFTEDAHQLEVLQKLQTLHDALVVFQPQEVGRPNASEGHSASFIPDSVGGFFSGLFGGESKTSSKPAATSLVANKSIPTGFYLYGEPGCGKTFLMDLAYKCAPVNVKKKRVHFNSFMLDVHQRIFRWRQAQGSGGDPLPAIAKDLAAEAYFLCFDEFQVTDVADAMILQRLFGLLFNHGVVVLATSNRAPKELYKNGIQRDRFLPFIDLLYQQTAVQELASGVDYRKLGTSLSDTYFFPIGPEATEKMDKAFERVCRGVKESPTDIEVEGFGRSMHVPRAAPQVARFTFKQLCNKPLGPADFLALSKSFNTVFIDDIPILSLADINPVRRLILCVDELYQARVRIVITADAPPHELFTTEGLGQFDEVFAFDRCVSRLVEMQSKEYLDAFLVRRAAHEAKTRGKASS